MKEAAYKGMVPSSPGVWKLSFGPYTDKLQDELEKVQILAAMFVTRNYVYETWSMTGEMGIPVEKKKG